MEAVILVLITVIGVVLSALVLSLSPDTKQPDTHHTPCII